jgi:hypothetical protein
MPPKPLAALFDDKLPNQNEIANAPKAAGVKHPPEQMSSGPCRIQA